jgi:hypothetical protein
MQRQERKIEKRDQEKKNGTILNSHEVYAHSLTFKLDKKPLKAFRSIFNNLPGEERETKTASLFDSVCDQTFDTFLFHKGANKGEVEGGAPRIRPSIGGLHCRVNV